ncbi:MAG: hypothetical protein Q4D73_06635 [Actinomycetaceae bacterium]|nr:hypothetical protein [Actinomycetaceae bacterium]
MSEFDWMMWARSCKVRNTTHKVVLNELALLCDASGSCIVSIAHLSKCAGKGRRQVFRVLDDLEKDGVLKREMRLGVTGRQQASRITLLKNPDAHLQNLILPPPTYSLPATIPSEKDDAGLRELMQCCIESGWVPRASEMLVETLRIAGRRLINAITRLRFDFDASFDDTLGRAFEICRSNAQTIVDADHPWAVLKTIVLREAYKLYSLDRNLVFTDDLQSIESYIEELSQIDSAIEKLEVDSVTTETVLADIAAAFISKGVDETVVQGAHKILLNIAANYGHSRRHTKAAENTALSMLVPSVKARRLWMSVIVGTRRNQWTLATPDVEKQAELIDRVVSLLKQ